MAFRFPLEAVFHLRQSVERQHELRLGVANQMVAGVRHLLEQFERRIAEIRARERQELSAGTTSAELRFALLSEAALHQRRGEIQRELSRLEALRDQQQEIFRQARRERETFESLRNRCRADYLRDRTRREQRQLDDLYLLRQAYLRRG